MVEEAGDLGVTGTVSIIGDAADAGEVLVSDVVRQLAAGKGFEFEERVDAILKGFDEPVRLYGVRWRG